MRLALCFLSLCCALLALPQDATACLHTPADYAGTVAEDRQQALIFYHDGREELILKVDYKLEGEEGALPDGLAWVVPVPTVPDAYGVTNPAIFEELFRLEEAVRLKAMESMKGRTLGGDGAENLEFLSKVSVGEYEIQPIKTSGPEAGTALNEWLSTGGYGEVPTENMSYYLDNGWTFLAIKVSKEKGQEAMADKGGLSPLRISFAADRIYYPLKFSSHQGIFKSTIYVITKDGLPVDELADELKGFGFQATDYPVTMDSGARRKAPELFKLWKEIHKEKRLTISKGVMNKIVSMYGINRPDSPLSDWEEDFSLPAP